ncbi:MAG: type I polyketide synthase, partial [Sphingomonas sp.]|nr:type I polyketide synthase [Sphingomonas sp.]
MNRSRYDFDMSGTGASGAAAEPIAIVGASCRLPGAPDLDSFWSMLLAGTDAVSEIPDDRWNKAQLFHPEKGQRGKAYTFAAGVLGDVSRFDPAFFGISPREATQMDPQQRLLLELAYEAIEDAGFDANALAGAPVGVFVGGSSWDYLNVNLADPSTTDAYSMIGITLCTLANRISYAFDLHGPSFTVDTACSSSLVALHQACEAIRAGQIPMAMVGGVSLLLAPQSYIGFCAASMLSPKGRCHAFDARADGYVRAEGGGIVILKPLGQALADGDPIRAVIRGTGVNSDGRTTGLSLPNRDAQAALLDQVYSRFGLDPVDLAYVEAHGTGTPAGDPIEAGALGDVLGRRRPHPLTIGSVKTNIGHLEAGSGMAGLIKAMLVAERGTIPPSLHCETPNPTIPFAELNLKLAAKAVAVAKGSNPYLVGVNSFGFGGTNAHAVLESPSSLPEPADEGGETLPPFLLSARSQEALLALASTWRDRIAAAAPKDLPKLLRGLALKRTQHKNRLVIPAETPDLLVEALKAFVEGKPAALAITNTAVAGKIGFIFSGNGSQWAGMAADAIATSASFRGALDTVDAALQPHLGWSVRASLDTPDAAALRNTDIAQPLLFAIQVALVLALREQGVEPDACMGHSVGEVAAAWASGALDLDAAARVIAVRSRSQQAQHDVGGMAVVGLDADVVAEAVAGTEVEVAARNSSQATTVAGTQKGLDALEASAPMRANVPFYSTVAGRLLNGTELDAGYWWRNVREPVLFAEAARAMVADGIRIFVELGPHSVVQAYLNDALRSADKEGRVLPSLSRRPGKTDPIAGLAARIHAAGGDIRGTIAFNGPATLRGLPLYPFQRERFWTARTEESTDRVTLPFEHPLLGLRIGDEPVEWTRHLSLETLPWLADHAVGGAAVVPAAALVEMALAAARARHENAASLDLLDVEIGRALVIEPHMLREIRLRVGSAAGDFTITSRPRLSEEPWTVHMVGRIAAADADEARPAAPAGSPTRHVAAPSLYALATKMGLDYGPAFQVVSGIDVYADERAVAKLDRATDLGLQFLLPPNAVDGALQGLLALAADRLGSKSGVLPWRFGRVRL